MRIWHWPELIFLYKYYEFFYNSQNINDISEPKRIERTGGRQS